MAIDLTAILRLKDKFTKPLDNARKKLGGLEGATNKVGATIAGIGAGAALAGFGKSVVETGRDFTSSMSGVRAVTNASDKDFERLQSTALEMGESTMYSASQAADAMQYLGMA